MMRDLLLNLLLVKNKSIKLPLQLKIKVSCFICIQLAHVLFQTSRLILSITKILSLTHKKCQRKPNIKGKIFHCSKLYPNQIFPHTINLNEKFDWLFIVDPI